MTRVTEYELDPVAPETATLVWSYVPANTCSFFAGSSFRLANDNTLIGWASDRTTLATEVDREHQCRSRCGPCRVPR